MAPNFRYVPPKILFQNANTYGGGHYRILLPSRLLRQTRHAVTQATMQALDQDSLEAMNPDSVVFQHLHSDRHLDQMRDYGKILKNAALIYEIDDVFWEVPDSSVHKNMVPADIKARMVKAAQLCGTMTVTTAPLAEVMRAATKLKDIRILPNQLPRSFINVAIGAARNKPQESRKLRVGWAGGSGHTGDLRLVAEIMDLLGDRVDWVFMGMSPPGVDPSRFETRDHVGFDDYAKALGSMHLDIALAPLEDNIFNRCKSDLRVLEYGACGFTVIASDIEPYRECPVIRLRHDAQAWADAICDMMVQPDLRFEQAERLHQWVVRNRVMDAHMYAYETAYLAKNAVPFTPHPVQRTGKVVTVGQGVADLDHYPSFAAAMEQAPDADVLYVRPGTPITPAQVVRIAAGLDRHASVCPLTNDGGFPRAGSFAPIARETAVQLDQAAALAASEPTPQAYPTGPCALLSAAALQQFGAPDEERFGSAENALMDWGARTAETGNGHAVVADTFVHTIQASSSTSEELQYLTKHAVLWTPPLLGALQQSRDHDPRKATREDLDLIFHSVNYTFPLPDQSYGDWTDLFDTPCESDIEAIKADFEEWDAYPTISVVLPTYNSNEFFLAVAVESVIQQAYPHWNLSIVDDGSTEPAAFLAVAREYAEKDPRITVRQRSENGHICVASNTGLEAATGEWVCFLDHDDVLAPHALYMIAREIRLHPKTQFIYSDSDKINQNGRRVEPYFAPDFNYELLLAQNYVTHLSAYRTAAVREIGGFRPGYEGSQDWDLTLRYLELTCGKTIDGRLIRHIPHVLYHWRQSEGSTALSIAAKPYALEAGRRAVMDHLVRTRQNAAVAPHPFIPTYNLVRFLVPEKPPLVSIIIPTTGADVAKLRQCIGSIMNRTAYTAVEVLIVNTPGQAPVQSAFLKFLTEVAKNPLIRVMNYPGKFNYSAVNNWAATQAKGEYLCLLNDDTEILETAWLNDMVGAAMRPKIGAVGPKLIYPNGTVQQSGTIFSPTAPQFGSALHAFQKLPFNHPGHFGRALLSAEFVAVTAACLLISRTAWEAVKGFDEAYPLDYGDVDLCLRLREAGFRNLVLPHILVQHHEGSTKRKNPSPDTWAQITADEERLRLRHKDTIDPFVNPNLAHEPHFDKLRIPAPNKPWETAERGRVLLINGTKEDAFQAYRHGQVAFCAVLDGHFLRFSYPIMHNVAPLDMRDTPDSIVAVLGKLGVPEIKFCGIGDGTLGVLGFLQAVAALGWPVQFTPNRSARGENPNDYVNTDGWRATWDSFLAITTKPEAEVRQPAG